jgi:hypothetical protein
LYLELSSGPLAGLIWVSLGVGAFVTLSALLAHPTPVTQGIPRGMEWIVGSISRLPVWRKYRRHYRALVFDERIRICADAGFRAVEAPTYLTSAFAWIVSLHGW